MNAPRRGGRLAAVALVLVSLLASCSTYDFATARAQDGELDVQRMIEDITEAEGASLGDLSWIPLVYFDLDLFALASPNIGSGYSMGEFDGYGPLFMFEAWTITHYDREGGPFERQTHNSYLWGLFTRRTSRIETTEGERLETRNKWLFGLLDSSSVHYDRR